MRGGCPPAPCGDGGGPLPVNGGGGGGGARFRMMYCCCCVAIGGGGCCCRGGAGGIPGPGPCQGPPNFMLLLLLYLRKKADTELLLFVFVLRDFPVWSVKTTTCFAVSALWTDQLTHANHSPTFLPCHVQVSKYVVFTNLNLLLLLTLCCLMAP